MKTTPCVTVAAFVLAAFNLSAATLYVSLESRNPVPPFSSWATAATNIQDAVDAATNGDTVLVTNGVYAVGSRDLGNGSNRVTITNSITLESVNGPLVTAIYGSGRCVYLGTNAVLSGFTLTNGYAYTMGGAVWCASVNAILNNCIVTRCYAGTAGGVANGSLYNCKLMGNVAHFSGGGVYGSALFNCIVATNSTYWSGGGASRCTLYNSVVVSNSAYYDGGGVVECTLYNCIVDFNKAQNGPNYFTGRTQWGEEATTLLWYSCTTPLPTNGIGNITGPPGFIDVEVGDFRLRQDSPCIDAGTNLLGMAVVVYNSWDGNWAGVGYVSDSTDMVGNTRFIDGEGDGIVAWDIGAYEFNSFKPPRFAGPPERIAEGWILNITGEPNKWTRVQRSGNLRDWDYIWSGMMPPEGFKQIIDGATGENLRFYRALVPQ